MKNQNTKTQNRFTRLSQTALFFSLLALLSGCVTPYVPDAKTPDLTLIPDGRYNGSYDASLVEAVVAVKVSGGVMTKIDILSHDCSPIGEKGEKIIDRVIKNQSLDVDVISGATCSSKTILKAIEDALENGKNS